MRFNKKGFSSIFLTIIIGSIIMLTFSFVRAGSIKAADSCYDSVFNLANNSILTEYDLDLKKEYGIIAFCLTSREIENRLSFYANSTFNNNRELNLIPIKIEDISVEQMNYALLNTEIFEKEILRIMKYKIANNVIKNKENVSQEDKDNRENRELKNQIIVNSLPSKGVETSNLILQLLRTDSESSLLETITIGGKNILIDKYINLYLNNNKKQINTNNKRFFKNEMEYIAYGKFSDMENKKKFLEDLIKIRTSLNLIHIYSDKGKVKEISLLANILSPGPGSIATQAIIATSWALAEAVNDKNILDSGGKVPLIKKPENWALSIESYKGIENGVILPKNETGHDYKQYLNLIIAFLNKEIKLLRTMDIIQINMKGNYNENFLFSEYFTGFTCQVIGNGKTHYYETKY